MRSPRPRITAMLLGAAVLLLAAPATVQASKSQFSIFDGGGLLLYDGTRDATLDTIRDMGTRDVRLVIYWRGVAPDPNSARRPSFNETDPNAYPAQGWEPYDKLIAAARARRMGVHLTVTGPPPRWADSRNNGPSATRFGRFVQAVAKRYRSFPKTWSMWNEPNQQFFLKPQWKRVRGKRVAFAPRIYRNLYLAGQRGLRAAGLRREPVLFGELAPRGGKSMAPLRFIREALCLDNRYRRDRRKCARLRANGIAYHVYVDRRGPFGDSRGDRVNLNALRRLSTAFTRAARARRINGGLGIYLTEGGVITKPRRDGASLSMQATYMSAAERVAYENPKVRAYAQYLLDDPPGNGSGGAFITGLRKYGGTPKPAFEAWRLPLVAQRTGKRGIRLWGLVRPARASKMRTAVTLEYKDRGRSWRRLKRVSTSARTGYFSSRSTYRRGRQFRVVWGDTTGPAVTPLTWKRPQR